MLTIYLIVMAVALTCGLLILWQVPFVKSKGSSIQLAETVSVIIPARNEAHNLPILLESLKKQSFQPFEIIVVDDNSQDETAAIAHKHGAHVLPFQVDVSGWVGKSAACWAGAQAAQGDYLLFLDADIFLPHSHSLDKILAALHTDKDHPALSIQPYHVIQAAYENFSAVFNILVLAGMNAFSWAQEKLEPAGAFGPSFLCRRATYFQLGGHARIKDAIMENVALGKVFQTNNQPIKLYGGKGVLHFRMYPNGLGELAQGWTKSFASGSKATHPYIMLGTSLWITGAFVSFISLFYFLLTSDFLGFCISFIGYLLFAGLFFRMAQMAGNFHWQAVLAYPLLFICFVGLFVWSFIKTHFLRQVSWKGRDINL